MTLTEAFRHFTESREFKAIQKQGTLDGGRYRTLLSRFNKGKLGINAIVTVLENNDYEVKASKIKKEKFRVYNFHPAIWRTIQ